MRKIIFRGIECYVAECRIKPEERKEGFNYYGIRHSDEDWGVPVTVEDFVVVNSWGTLATREKLEDRDDIISYRYGEDDSRFCINLLGEDDGVEDMENESFLFMSAAGQDFNDSSVIDENDEVTE